MPTKIFIIAIIILLIAIGFLIWFLLPPKQPIEKKPAMSGFEGDTMFIRKKKIK